MSHLDEGTLHAMLDGELENTEMMEIQAHLGSCSACGLRLREVKEYLAEADRLIASVEPAPATASAAPPASAERPAAGATRRPPPPRSEPDSWVPPGTDPILLIPDNETAADRRSRMLRRLGKAAAVLLVVGGGYLGVRRLGPVSIPIDEVTDRVADAVVSTQEAFHQDTSVTVASAPAAKSAQPAAERQPAATPPAAKPQTPEPKPTPPPPAAAAAPPKTEPARTEPARQDSAPELAAGDEAAEDSVPVEDMADVRARAAEALADLDRQRRADRAAAAMAALDAAKRRNAEAAPVSGLVAVREAAPPPPPPTPEERAGIYLRIGLDEAARQLGGPAHVIEGMSPMFMGLAQGRLSPGADSTRPVVRVVYQDSQGRYIILDQQRVRPGQPAAAGSPLFWMQGDVSLRLQGEASREVLRTLRPRVR